MVKLRLQRYGAKKRPFYRLVATDVRNPRDGRFIEQLGYCDTASYVDRIELKEDRVKHWISCGAIPSETVRAILKKKGLLDVASTAS